MNPQKSVILCVDDHEEEIKLLENILVPRGFEVIAAPDGQSALVAVRKHRIDIIVLDALMPGMDGFAVCKKIKDTENLRNIPIIMLTSLQSKSDRIKGIESGAEDFISKPFDKGEVIARITNLLKVKELNDRLNAAYDNINNLTIAGEHVIKTISSGTIESQNFSVMPMLDIIANQLLRKSSDIYDKPQIVIVRILDEKHGYEWHQYESVFDKLQRHPIVLDVKLKLTDPKESKMFHCNTLMVEKMFGSLTEKLKAFNISVENLVCYLSNALVVIALNYGRDVSKYDAAVLETLVVQTLYMRSLSLQARETEESFVYTIHALARAAEANDEDTGNHIFRVGQYCTLLAAKLGMSEAFIKDIGIQATLHDVGKIHIHPDVLKKAGALTQEEWKIIKQHPVFGANIIGKHQRLKLARSIALSHHEKWDGSGYPDGFAGENILVAGRITAIADC
ncbi:MAG: response regulator, partial [Nitrospirae bacterium]|nr:response regulator [Nitrospirota bacterium]